ncbi:MULTISPECIES: hypothetical protein [Oligella]|uniref:hypothetical protein n=1 Tax=Oligella TaxID=90243 RepID=UPI000660EA8B|nr:MULTISPECIES: hypothetical protein [Oligella]OFV49700.1 hypothetical protein HMPREF3179_03575 [Oligella sp. HMSC09E12]
MIKLKAANLRKFEHEMNKWIKESELEATEVARGLAVTGFNQILERSAQRSGDFAANWQFSINAVNYTFKNLKLLPEGASPDDWFIMGDKPAINYAKQNNKGRDRGYKLGDTFYVSNSATNAGNDYAVWIEEGSINFREGNLGMPVASAMIYIGSLYGHIGKVQVQQLIAERL